MSYVDQKRGPSPTGMAGALIVQAAIGAAMIIGLSVAGGVVAPPTQVDAWNIKDPPPPEPPPPEPAKDPAKDALDPPITVPQPKFELDQVEPDYTTTDTIPDRPLVIQPKQVIIDPPPAPPAPVATFDPIGAKPRNDPAAWLGQRDYKPSWLRRELMGTARFRLDISATGTVTGCRVTGSTGHAELDEATCALVQRRARFEPARGSSGQPVAGSYTGSVLWQIPD